MIVDNPRVRIGLNEVALGVRFPPRIHEIVRRRVAQRALDRVVLGAELFDPHGALALGLVDEVAANVDDVATARLTALASHPRAAYAIAKRDLRGDEGGLCPEDDHARRIHEMLPQWTSRTVRDRIAAALGKR